MICPKLNVHYPIVVFLGWIVLLELIIIHELPDFTFFPAFAP